MNEKEKKVSSLDLPFATTSSSGQDVTLSTRYSKVTAENKHEFVKLALEYRYGGDN